MKVLLSRGFSHFVNNIILFEQCLAPCGTRGRQRRSVLCVDAKGSRVRRSLCARENRPRRKQRCWAHPCGHTTCQQVFISML